MKDFILSYWKYLVVALAWLVNFVIILLKKNKVEVKDTYFTQLLLRLPGMIAGAEASGDTGENKKLAVLSYAISYLVDLTGMTSEEVSKKYLTKISEAIENILLTPKKKEEK